MDRYRCDSCKDGSPCIFETEDKDAPSLCPFDDCEEQKADWKLIKRADTNCPECETWWTLGEDCQLCNRKPPAS